MVNTYKVRQTKESPVLMTGLTHKYVIINDFYAKRQALTEKTSETDTELCSF